MYLSSYNPEGHESQARSPSSQDFAVDGWQPIHHAAANGETIVLRELIRRRASVHVTTGVSENTDECCRVSLFVLPFLQFGSTPLHCAASRGHILTVRELLMARAHVYATGDSHPNDIPQP